MTAQNTPFAGLTALPPGDSLSEDGYAFQFGDRYIIDRLLQLGAVGHFHDSHVALPDPTDAPVIASAIQGGAIPAGQAIFVCYTWTDQAGGETAPTDPAQITTPLPLQDPTFAPAAAVDYVGGGLLAGSASYAVTVTDGLGGETVIGPAVTADILPGNPNAEVALSGLAAVVAASNLGGLSTAGWRLWRQIGGGPWYLIGTGQVDAFVDTGIAGDCTVAPPFSSTAGATNTLDVTVPAPTDGSQPTQFTIYASYDGSFVSPSVLGVYPASDFGGTKTYTDLTLSDGAPPAVSTSLPGAHQINPDLEMVWALKSPVDTSADLAVGSYGDLRVALDTKLIWAVLNPAGATTPADWTDLIPPPGVVVEGTQASAVTYAPMPIAEASFPPNTIADFTNLGVVPMSVWDGVPSLGHPRVTPPDGGPLLLTSSTPDTAGHGDLNEWLLDRETQTQVAPFVAEWTSGGTIGEGRRLRVHWTRVEFLKGPFAAMLDVSADGTTGMGIVFGAGWWGSASFFFQTKRLWEAFPQVTPDDSYHITTDGSATNYQWKADGTVGALSNTGQIWTPVGEVGVFDLWLELYYEGNILHGNIYGADPETGAAPTMSAHMDMTGIYAPGSGTGHAAVAAGPYGMDTSTPDYIGDLPGVKDIRVVLDGLGTATDFVSAGSANMQLADTPDGQQVLTTTDPTQTTAFHDPYDQSQVPVPWDLGGGVVQTKYIGAGDSGEWDLDQNGTYQWGRPVIATLTTAIHSGDLFSQIEVTPLSEAVVAGDEITLPAIVNGEQTYSVFSVTVAAAAGANVVQVAGYNAANPNPGPSGPTTALYDFPVGTDVWFGKSGVGHAPSLYVIDWNTATGGVNTAGQLAAGVPGGYAYPGVQDFVPANALNAKRVTAGEPDSQEVGTLWVPSLGSVDVVNPVRNYNPLEVNYPGDRLAVLAPATPFTDFIGASPWTEYTDRLVNATPAQPLPGGQQSTMAEFVWVGRVGTHANGDGQWVLTTQYMGAFPPPQDAGNAYLNNPVWWDKRRVGRASGPGGYGSAPVAPNIYAYQWRAPGQFADGYKFRVKMHGVQSLVNGGTDQHPFTDYPAVGVAMNLTDQDDGLVWYLAGWTKKPSDLMFWGDHIPPEIVRADGSYALVGQYPQWEGTRYIDGTQPETSWENATPWVMSGNDIGSGSLNALKWDAEQVAPPADDIWLEAWRVGETCYAAYYVADPATGGQPIFVSEFAEPQATGSYAPGQAGYFGVVTNFLNPDVGFSDFTVLEIETGNTIATLPGQQTTLEFTGGGVNVIEDPNAPGTAIIEIEGHTGGTGPQGDPGPQGPQGPRGSEWFSYTGSGTPAVGHFAGESNGDFCIRESDGEVFERVAGAWVDQGYTLRGPAGATGVEGPAGPAGAGHGSAWFEWSGAGAPPAGTFTGEADLDFAVRESDGEIFQRVSGGWVDQGWSLRGPQGAAGAAGPAGAAGAVGPAGGVGATGPRGSEWFVYTGAGGPPVGTFTGEANMDMCVRQSDGEVFQRIGGGWVDQGFSLKGPAGATGPAGAAGSGGGGSGGGGMALVFSDDFAANDIANYTTPSGGITIAGGQAVASGGDDRLFVKDSVLGDWADVVAQVKFTPGNGASDLSLQARLAAQGIWAHVHGGNVVELKDFYSGSPMSIASATFSPTVGTPFWLRLVLRGQTAIAEVWGVDPTSLPAVGSTVKPLAMCQGAMGAAAAVYGTVGIRMNGNATDRADDLKVWGGGPQASGGGGGSAPSSVIYSEDFTAEGAMSAHWVWEDAVASPVVETASGLQNSAGGVLTATLNNLELANAVATMKILTGAGNISAGPVMRRSGPNTSAGDYMYFGYIESGNIEIRSRSGGGYATFASMGGGGVALAAATVYWLRAYVVGASFGFEVWTVDPDSDAALSQKPLYAVAGVGDSGGGHPAFGEWGFIWVPSGTAERIESFKLQRITVLR